MTPIDAVVLAGGRSRRMGRDKAAMPLDGQRMVDRMCRRLEPLGGQVIIARGDQPSLGLVDEVADEPGLVGPMAGIVAGLRAVRSATAAIVAVDMPSVDPIVLRRLDELMRAEGRAAALPLVHGVAQPLHAVIDTEALPVIIALALGGEGSPRRLMARIDALLVGPDGWGPLDPVGAFAADWDSPTDIRSTAQG